MRALLPLLAAAALAWPAAPAASVRMVDQVRFAEAVDAGGTPLRLAGAGLFRWKWVFKVYAAAHYLPPESAPLGPAADVARRLEFGYLVDIDGEGFGKAADELLARSFPPEVLAPLRERLDRLHAAYVDVKPGDRYALTYQPGQGTELSYNGRPLARVEGRTSPGPTSPSGSATRRSTTACATGCWGVDAREAAARRPEETCRGSPLPGAPRGPGR